MTRIIMHGFDANKLEIEAVWLAAPEAFLAWHRKVYDAARIIWPEIPQIAGVGISARAKEPAPAEKAYVAGAEQMQARDFFVELHL